MQTPPSTDLRKRLEDITSEGRPQDDLIADLMVILSQERNHAYALGRGDTMQERAITGGSRVGKTLHGRPAGHNSFKEELEQAFGLQAQINKLRKDIDGIYSDLRKIFDVLTNDYTARYTLAREWMEKTNAPRPEAKTSGHGARAQGTER